MGSVPEFPSGSGIQEQILRRRCVVRVALVARGQIDVEPFQRRSVPTRLFTGARFRIRAVRRQGTILHKPVAPFSKPPQMGLHWMEG